MLHRTVERESSGRGWSPHIAVDTNGVQVASAEERAQHFQASEELEDQPARGCPRDLRAAFDHAQNTVGGIASDKD